MIISVDTTSGIPLYLQIADGIRDAIIAGRVSPGRQLPTIRDAASLWRVNPGTVASAYELLLSEGLLRARTGLGTFVAEDLVGSEFRRRAEKCLAERVVAAAEAAVAVGVSESGLRRLIRAAIRKASRTTKEAES